MRFVSFVFVMAMFMVAACATTRPVVETSSAVKVTPTVITTSNTPQFAGAPEPCHAIELTPESDYCTTRYLPSDPCYIPVCGCPEPEGYKPVVGSDGQTIHACLMKPHAEK